MNSYINQPAAKSNFSMNINTNTNTQPTSYLHINFLLYLTKTNLSLTISTPTKHNTQNLILKKLARLPPRKKKMIEERKIYAYGVALSMCLATNALSHNGINYW